MIIVKVGGGEGINYDAVCDDIAQLWREGQQLIFVHGGSHRTNQVAEALGHPPQFVTSPSGYTSRLTDRATLEIFQMVYCGQINKTLVERLQRRGVNAVGLSGIDGRIWQGPRKKVIKVVENGRIRVLRSNLTGKVTQVNHSLLQNLLHAGCLPVLTPPAISFDGEAMNVDGDRAAAATAAAFRADELLILSNVPGVLRQFPDENSLISQISADQIECVSKEFAEGRMRIKLLGAREAVTSGVRRVVLGDARGRQPILRALDGLGTVIIPTQAEEAA
ncbi:[LysW]-aminoadipate kinase [Candidatus Leptofilum sp.]|uniref:[LysW]-aminoadipate kinase n=1 Tax=Candidatus Leptofilum sp. TaxID=3241576 RepID=UPI003B598EF5